MSSISFPAGCALGFGFAEYLGAFRVLRGKGLKQKSRANHVSGGRFYPSDFIPWLRARSCSPQNRKPLCSRVCINIPHIAFLVFIHHSSYSEDKRKLLIPRI